MASGFNITSASFGPNTSIPGMFTCEGDGVSPQLAWNDPSEEAETFVVIVDDPDAPGRTFVHWVLFNLPSDCRELPRDLDIDVHFEDSSPQPVEGVNDFGDIGYGPPCPPTGDGPHGYSFRLYALDTTLDLGPGADKKQVTQAMDGHVVDEANLVGSFERS